MDRCWIIKYPVLGTHQRSRHRSYEGGKPHLPEGVTVPLCKLCGHEQTFFFQVAFPDGHPWQDYTLSVFSCKSCFDEQHIIPERFCPSLKDAQISSQFLKDYQTNFRFVVFPTNSGKLVSSYSERIRFRPWRLARRRSNEVLVRSKVGGVPSWSYEDETPGLVDGQWQVSFLLQLEDYYRFRRHSFAPPEWGFGKRHGEYERMEDFDYYWLFSGGHLYMFGASVGGERVVIFMTQR